MITQSNISNHQVVLTSANHANAIEIEDLAFNEKKRSEEVCLFGRFTRSVYYLLRLVPAELVLLIKSTINTSLCCCCLSVEHILTTIPFGSFDVLPRLLKRCDFGDCTRCAKSSAEQTRQWSRLESFGLSKKLDTVDADAYSQGPEYSAL